MIGTARFARAPKGSTAYVADGDRVEFGRGEGLGLYLNGTDLPDHVYAESDVNELIGQLTAAIGDAGSMHSHWQGPRETALYIYGSSAQRMSDLVREVLNTHPLAQHSRLVNLAADPTT